ncbi:hypothetical protein [Alysiella crassa]|uniref:hypothetical protein n=1 Tax=Alysiella crassa TaxID=153491 RepID=UPI0011C03D34|nr:hypothetical protein [Alysiella crassa]UOP07710.1 hypothetical protein LVJ80_04965 [Alysiella crassa]
MSNLIFRLPYSTRHNSWKVRITHPTFWVLAKLLCTVRLPETHKKPHRQPENSMKARYTIFQAA